MLLEDLGLAGRGEAAARLRSGYFNCDGALPLNTHGGLLTYGHCGVGGAMAHLVETHLQMTGRADNRQVHDASIALLHGDGGVLSSHVSMFLDGRDERERAALVDWTAGAEAIVFQSCSACGAVQYFRRSFCADCGAQDPADRLASGTGTVHAATLVCRAADAGDPRATFHTTSYWSMPTRAFA